MGYGKILAAVGVVGVLGVALSGGDADASDNTTRDPWTKPIDVPTDEEMSAVKQAFCACFRGGATDEETLTVCALKQVYGDEPWKDLLVAVNGDSREVRTVVGTFRKLARELLELPNDAAVTQWCGGTVPDPIVDPPPPPPEDDPKTKVRNWWLEMKSAVAMPGFFREIVQGDGGLEVLAREVYKALEIDSPDYQDLVLPLMISFSRGKRWNRKLYGRTAAKKTANSAGETWYASDGTVIKPAWLPRNEDADAAVLAARAPKRNIYNDGKKMGPGSSYGTVYVPRFNVELARDQGVFVVDDDANYDPPAEFLALLGM